MIWIIGGTSDVFKLLREIHGKLNYVITVTTQEGLKNLKAYNVLLKPMELSEMIDFIKEKEIRVIVDMSHPFALCVSINAEKAAEACGIKYIRFLRKNILLNGCLVLENYTECAEFLKNAEGNVFFTIGSKNVEMFEKIKKEGQRFIYRVLPALFSIENCLKAGIDISNIIAVKGPFSRELNAAMFKEYSAKYVVMKDSGREGGTLEKIEACHMVGAVPLVIQRPKEDGESSIKKIILEIKSCS